jgi:hypothetical protein
MLIEAVDAATNTAVPLNMSEYGMPPQEAVALKQPDAVEGARWLTNCQEVQEFLWWGADIFLLRKPLAGTDLACQIDEQHIARSAGV